MPRRRSERAQRRIRQRTVKNALSLEAIADEQEARPKFKRARHAEQLALLLHRGAISDRQKAAGDRSARDYRQAGDLPQVTMRYEPRMSDWYKKELKISEATASIYTVINEVFNNVKDISQI